MGIVEVRKAKLLALLAERKKMTIKEVARYFGISLPTARLLCSKLSNEGKAFREHGGIRYLPAIETTYVMAEAVKEFATEKRSIGRYASRIINDNCRVFLEAGSTVFELAVVLAERIRNGELSNLVLFTNSMSNLGVLSPVSEVSLIGGTYRMQQQDFRGYLSDRIVSVLRFDYVFIGCDGISLENGIMALDMDTVRFVEILMQRTDKIILLADSEKFHQNSLITSIPIDKISMIITDSKLDDDIYNSFLEANVNIVRVDTSEAESEMDMGTV